MTELTRRIEPADVINSMASINIPLETIRQRGKLQPHELPKIKDAMGRLLDLRAVIDVQKYGREGLIPEAANRLFEVATHAINDVNLLMLHGPAATSVDRLLDSYGDAVEAGLYLVNLIDRNLEERYKLVLRWTNR